MTAKAKGESGKRLFTIRDVLPLLSISDSTLRRMIRAGAVKIKRIGSGRGMIYISAPELTRLSQLTAAEIAATIDSTPTAKGHIYLVRVDRFHKVGRSRNIRARLSTWSSLPFEVEVLHSFISSRVDDVEAYLHSTLGEYRVKGEWYQLPPDAVERIQMVEDCGLDSLAIAWTEKMTNSSNGSKTD